MDNMQSADDIEMMRYLDKEMNPVEKTAFENKLMADEKLRAEFNSLQTARAAVMIYGIKQQVAKVHAEERHIKEAETPVVKMPLYYKFIRYAVAAACLLLIFIGVNRYNQSKISSDDLYAEAYIPFESFTTRGDSSEILPIEKAYRDKKYSEIIKIYGNGGSTSSRQMLIVGICFMETGAATEAIESFRSLLAMNKKNNISSYNDEASYYLALAYLKNKDYPGAVEMMQKIHGDKENIYNEKFSAGYIERVKKLK